ncbi:hypothetical protein [Archangium lansingense]|uniref:Lipoprotein n=1 Tax=Archangium lansingense TaxID=2995310 RepID=A0ABT4AQ59_9BACT|nr:hypothetical protein [Archangium lansinium]MCY1082974.1 hypothetical protein [Archangium lansinium]
MCRCFTVLLPALLALCAACTEPTPAALRFKTQPANGYALERLSPVEVEILDEDGDRIESSNAAVLLSLYAGAYSSELVGTRYVVAEKGVARFHELFVTKEGIDLQLVATLNGGLSVRSDDFSVAPVSEPPVGVVFRSAFLDVEAGQPLPTFEVAIVTEAGVPYTRTDAPVEVSLAGVRGGDLSGTLVVNAERGVATFTGVSVLQSGEGVALHTSAPGLTGMTSQPFDVVPVGASRLVFRVQPSFTRVGVPFSPVVEVSVVDASGKVMTTPERPITLSFGSNLYNAQLTGPRTVETVDGVASFPGLAVDRYLIDSTLIARSLGSVGAESAKFSVAP